MTNLSSSQQQSKRSKFVGVSWDKQNKKWKAAIRIGGKQKTLGLYHDEKETARMYDEQAAFLNRPVNFPQHEGQEQAVKHRKDLSKVPDVMRQSEFVGVTWYTKNKKWTANIRIDGKLKNLGYFDDEKEAACKYDEQAALLNKPVNFPQHEGQKQAVKYRKDVSKVPDVTRRSKFVGVSWNKQMKKWNAQIRIDGKNKTLGHFDDEKEAANAYDKVASAINRPVNFPDNFPEKNLEQAVKDLPSFAEHEKSKYWHPNKNGSLKPEDFTQGSNQLVFFSCPKCKKDFSSLIKMVVSNNKWCRYCPNKTEQKLLDFLEKNKDIFQIDNIKYHYRPSWGYLKELFQFTKKGIKTYHHTFFEYDYLIKLKNGIKIIIELDGPQHYKQVSNWPSPLTNQIRDKIKERLAKKNKINLIRLNQNDVLLDKKNEWKNILKIFIKKCRNNTKKEEVITENAAYHNTNSISPLHSKKKSLHAGEYPSYLPERVITSYTLKLLEDKN